MAKDAVTGTFNANDAVVANDDEVAVAAFEANDELIARDADTA